MRHHDHRVQLNAFLFRSPVVLQPDFVTLAEPLAAGPARCDISRQRRQKLEYKLVERVGYLELREVAAAGQHHASPSQDAGLEGAGVRVNVRDVVLADDDQRRHGDLAQPRQRSRLR